MTEISSKTAIIGIGLIGSSMARALRETGRVDEIVGYDQSADVRGRAVECGALDSATDSLCEAIAGADLIVLSTPVGAMAKVLSEISENARDGALVIDVGSVKGTVVEAAEKLRSRAHIVPCHPVAGTEQSGPEAGFASLFRDRWSIITPLVRNDSDYLAAVKRAADIWRAVGANVEIMDHQHHDLALAITSHLPHLIAFTLVGAADDLESVAEAEIVKYSAGGFRDFTRIAASDPIMWRDVFLNNKTAILEVLGRFTEELSLLQRAIRWGDAETLERVFARGRALRRAIVAAGQEKDVPNFGRDEKPDHTMVLAALMLAVIAGFAAQRGSICAVAAVRDLVINRRWRRYVAFLECAAWSLLVLSLARTFGLMPSSLPQDYSPSLAAVIGGALFGAGAALNGACTFGAAARLGRGEVAFAAMPIGFLLGVMAADTFAALPRLSSNPVDITTSSGVVTGLVFFAGFQFFRMTDAVSGPRDAISRLAAPEWRPSLAMGVIGLSSALLMIFFAPWPYSKLLTDIATGGAGEHFALKIILAIAFVGGASIGAATRGALKLILPTPRALAEKTGAGMLMGAGSFFVPGGNDSLVLVGLPHLFGYAIIAYLSMSAMIAVIVLSSMRRP